MPNSLAWIGEVVAYPYRWKWELEANRSPDGAKDRPCCLLLAASNARGETNLYLLAISSKSPRQGREAIEIPETERRRAGLTAYPQAWIYVDEFNLDVAERSPYYDPAAVQGKFSLPFLQIVAAALQANLKARTAATINRG